MNRFKNILVVMNNHNKDDENSALEKGINLAKKNAAKVLLFQVVDTPSNMIKDFEGIFGDSDLTSILIAKEKHKLEDLCQKYRDEGVDIDSLVVPGKDFIEVLRQMLIGDHDLLIKTAELQLNSFSSSDFHLMRKCPTPVWLIKPDRSPAIKKVMAAVDLAMEDSEEGQATNKMILDLASTLALSEDSELVILSCWSLHGEHTMRYSNFINISTDEVDKLVEKEKQLNEQKLEEITQRFKDHPVKKILLKGNPKQQIPKFVAKEDISTTVMGTVARTGIQGLLIGNTSETILRELDSSVITIKPPGFEGLITR